MSNTLELVVRFVFQAGVFFFVLRFLLQACRVDFYNPISQGVVKITDVLLKPIRLILPGRGSIDYASFLAAWAAVVGQVYLLAALSDALIGNAVFVVSYGLLEVLLGILFVFKWAIIIMIVASWIAPGNHHPALALVQQLVDPILAPARRIIPAMGGLDLSPMLVILVLIVLESALPEMFRSVFLG
ncbi:MAG: YggT family protein [Pseudomonadales bacterium]|jgi:YggT family protein|nr:YggT family protein [Pseudomonadales bacterium]MDP6469457.1 YggT family protein [Pseudomonadales bacterium]MDP6827299.1 YggT family protein [Pseudomonadales bacterium]MDP6971122.1 YggT family protein [Pseudomonadales bacterium]|tara:strand:- start:3631 stop:4188 length:558 start_codon:yes stop_codon:yes gene_type:complete